MSPQRLFWTIVLSSAAILAVTMGIRQSTGLFVSPLNSATGLGIVTISFALAIGQFVWGVAQPLFGMLAGRTGSFRVIVLGALLLAFGMALTPLMDTGVGLIVSMGILTAAGAGAGSFSILIGAATQRLPAERRSFAAGFINAGGSFGQFVFAPLAQALINAFGWINAMLTLAAATLSTILLALPLREKKRRGRIARRRAGGRHHAACADADCLQGPQLNRGFRENRWYKPFYKWHQPVTRSQSASSAAIGVTSSAPTPHRH